MAVVHYRSGTSMRRILVKNHMKKPSLNPYLRWL